MPGTPQFIGQSTDHPMAIAASVGGVHTTLLSGDFDGCVSRSQSSDHSYP
jgi:hypothetical protein